MRAGGHDLPARGSVSCVAERQSDETGALARLHAEHERALTFLAGVRELLADIRRVGDRLAADIQDHITHLEAVVGSDATRIDGGDDDATAFRAGHLVAGREREPELR